MKSKGFLQRVFDMSARKLAHMEAAIEKDFAKFDRFLEDNKNRKTSLLEDIYGFRLLGRAFRRAVVRKVVLQPLYSSMQKSALLLADKINRPLNV